MSKKSAISVFLIAIFVLLSGCGASVYATSERMEVLSDKYDELKAVSNEVSEKLTSTRDADESYYNEFNDLAVSANILVTEINSYIGKQIEKDVCESLIARCEEMNDKYKALEEKIDALADRTTAPPSENGD